MLLAPRTISLSMKANIEIKLNIKMIQTRKLANGDELEDESRSDNRAAAKMIIDNCLVERKTPRLLISKQNI